jgi:hypothetical protein
MNKLSPAESQHAEAQRARLEGFARMHERMIRAGEPTQDELIKQLALAQATLEIERKRWATMMELLPKVTLATIKSNTTGKGGESTAKKKADAETWIQNEFCKEWRKYTTKTGRANKTAFAEAYATRDGNKGLMASKSTHGGRDVKWIKKALTGIKVN